MTSTLSCGQLPARTSSAISVPLAMSTWPRPAGPGAAVNVTGSANIAEAARQAGARVVYASTWEVYGEPQYEPVDEDHPVRTGPSLQHHQTGRRAHAHGGRASERSAVVALRLGTATDRASAPTRSSGSSSTGPVRGSPSRSRATAPSPASSPTPTTSPGPSLWPHVRSARAGVQHGRPRTHLDQAVGGRRSSPATPPTSWSRPLAPATCRLPLSPRPSSLKSSVGSRNLV